MVLSLKNNWKQQLPFALIVVLMVGLVYSRAVLSVTAIGLGFTVLLNRQNLQPYKNIFTGFALILLPVLASGLWSVDTTAWWRSVEVKLSLITIIAGILAAQFSFKQIKQLVWWLTIVVISSAFYSCYEYWLNEQLILKSYLVAKVMPVLMDDDHIRYSWLIVLNILLLTCVVFLPQRNEEHKGKLEQWIAAVVIFFLIAYLHFLAAKTGLLCLYVSLAITGLCLIVKVKWWAGFLLIAAIGLFAFAAYQNFPSLKNRVQYVLYDFGNYSKGIYTEGSSDGARVLSLKAGWDITQQHVLGGVGFGDVQTEVAHWHDMQHPSSKDYERFLPTNQLLIYSAGSGLLGLLCFCIGLLLLLQSLFSKNIFYVVLITVLLLPLMTDDSFEGQHGVSIFALFVGLGIGVKRGGLRA